MSIKTFTPIGVTFETIDKLCRDGQTDAVALYMAYTCVTHWQKTYRPKATASFMQKRLKWSKEKFLKAKKVLKDIGLVDDIAIQTNTGVFSGHYIQVNHIVDDNVDIEPVGMKTSGLEIPPSGKTPPQVLSTNSKVLSTKESALCKTNVLPKTKKKEVSFKDAYEYLDNVYETNEPDGSIKSFQNRLIATFATIGLTGITSDCLLSSPVGRESRLRDISVERVRAEFFTPMNYKYAKELYELCNEYEKVTPDYINKAFDYILENNNGYYNLPSAIKIIKESL